MFTIAPHLTQQVQLCREQLHPSQVTCFSNQAQQGDPDCHHYTMADTAILCVTVRALCRSKLLPVTHILVDTCILTVKPVYKLVNVPDDLKWTTNTHVTPFTRTYKA